MFLFPSICFWKKYYFLFFTLEIFITLRFTYLYHSFRFYLYSFIIFLSFFLYIFLKNYYTKTKKMIFHYSNAILFYFSISLKISLRSYMFLLTHIIFIIFIFNYFFKCFIFSKFQPHLTFFILFDVFVHVHGGCNECYYFNWLLLFFPSWTDKRSEFSTSTYFIYVCIKLTPFLFNLWISHQQRNKCFTL